jgi:hypothetical protein
MMMANAIGDRRTPGCRQDVRSDPVRDQQGGGNPGIGAVAVRYRRPWVAIREHRQALRVFRIEAGARQIGPKSPEGKVV